jgi:fatty acid synthase
MNNIVKPVYFQTAIERLPTGTTIIEIGPSSSLLSQVKRIRSDVQTLGIVRVGEIASEASLVSGSQLWTHVWQAGCVSRTQEGSLGDRLRLPIDCRFPNLWNHAENHRVFTYQEFAQSNATGDNTRTSSVTYDIAGTDAYLLDHRVNGRSLFPATGYLATAWQAVDQTKPIQFATFEILRAVVLDPESEPHLVFQVHRVENLLTITHQGVSVARMTYRILSE